MSNKGNVQRRVRRILMLILGCSGSKPTNFRANNSWETLKMINKVIYDHELASQYFTHPSPIDWIKYPRIGQLHTFQYSCSLLSFHAILRRHHSAVYHGLQTAQDWKIFLSGSHLLLFAEDECCEINKHYRQFSKSGTKSWLFSSFVWLPKTQKHLICNIFTHLHNLKTKF